MDDDRPIFRRIIDAIHELQAKTRTISEQSAAGPLELPAAVSRTPRSGTAITRFQAVYAQHYPLAVGSVLQFGDERRVVKTVKNVIEDIGIATWDEPISVQPMKILPWDWTRYIPVYRDGWTLKAPLPVVRGNQHYVGVRDSVIAISNQAAFPPSGGKPHPTPIIPGDSGCPVYLPLAEPVLIGCLGTRASCSSLARYWDKVAMWAPEVKEAAWA